jgi:hypothetical protein
LQAATSGVGSPEGLVDAAREELGSLIHEHGFVLKESSAEAVRFESAAQRVFV